jgi:hypothetical protein
MMIKLFLKKCNTKSLKNFYSACQSFLGWFVHVALSSDFSNFFLFLYLLFFLLDLYFHSAETFVRKNFLSVYFEFETIKQEVFLCLYRLVLADFQSER